MTAPPLPAGLWYLRIGRLVHISRTLIAAGCTTECGIDLQVGMGATQTPPADPRLLCEGCKAEIQSLGLRRGVQP